MDKDMSEKELDLLRESINEAIKGKVINLEKENHLKKTIKTQEEMVRKIRRIVEEEVRGGFDK